MRAEGRHLVNGVVAASIGLALVGIAGLLLLAGLTLMMWGVFMAVGQAWGRIPAAFVTGLLALVLARGVLWTVSKVWK